MKGSIFDSFGVALLLFVSAVVVLLIAFVFSEINTTLGGIPIFADNEKAMYAMDAGMNTLYGMDGIFAMFTVLVCMVTVISAFMAPTHPVLFLTFILLTTIAVPLAAEFANAYTEIYSTDILSATSDHYPITISIMEYLPTITIILSGIIAIVMWFRGEKYA